MVLIDPDNEAKSLQLLTLKKMKLSLEVVNSTERILSSFNGATLVTLRDVTLSVKFKPMTQQVDLTTA